MFVHSFINNNRRSTYSGSVIHMTVVLRSSSNSFRLPVLPKCSTAFIIVTSVLRLSTFSHRNALVLVSTSHRFRTTLLIASFSSYFPHLTLVSTLHSLQLYRTFFIALSSHQRPPRASSTLLPQYPVHTIVLLFPSLHCGPSFIIVAHPHM